MGDGVVRTRAIVGLALVAALVCAPAAIPTASAKAAATNLWEREPNLAEWSLLALVNKTRSQPSVDGYGSYPAVPPLVWNDGLATAARYHLYDMIERGCFQHDSCNGTSFATRMWRYYPSSFVGENITALGGGPRGQHLGWLASAGHRSNILHSSYAEFGSGSALNFNSWINPDYGVEDFGYRGSVAVPTIPAAAVLTPVQWSGPNWDWELLVNYYDGNGRAPAAVNAIVDGVEKPLSKVAGTDTHGSWGATLRTPSASTQPCRNVHFEVRRSDGATFRWPASGSIRVGHWSNCWDQYAIAGTEGSTTPPPSFPPAGAPAVTIHTPSDGATVTGAVVIRASATDDGTVKRMDVLVDGKRKARRAKAELVFTWNARAAMYKPGPHTITIEATDDAGNVARASIVVTKP